MNKTRARRILAGSDVMQRGVHHVIAEKFTGGVRGRGIKLDVGQ